MPLMQAVRTPARQAAGPVRQTRPILSTSSVSVGVVGADDLRHLFSRGPGQCLRRRRENIQTGEKASTRRSLAPLTRKRWSGHACQRGEGEAVPIRSLGSDKTIVLLV